METTIAPGRTDYEGPIDLEVEAGAPAATKRPGSIRGSKLTSDIRPIATAYHAAM